MTKIIDYTDYISFPADTDDYPIVAVESLDKYNITVASNGVIVIRNPKKDAILGRALILFNPDTGAIWEFYEGMLGVTDPPHRGGVDKSSFYQAAREWLNMHPTKSWHRAKPGEIWDVTTDAGENRMIVWDVGGQFTFVKVELHGPAAIPILSEEIKHAVLKLEDKG